MEFPTEMFANCDGKVFFVIEIVIETTSSNQIGFPMDRLKIMMENF